MKFPKQLFVRIEVDGDDTYYPATTDVDEELGKDGERIGIYELKVVKCLVKTARLV